MEHEDRIWEGDAHATTSVLFSTGDEGRATDPLPAALRTALVSAGVRVGLLPCIGGDLATRDTRATARLRRVAGEVTGRLILAGSSRGARLSAELAETAGATALIALAYPFHDRTDPDPRGRDRTLAAVPLPVLLIQGTRDSHGNREQVRGYRLPQHITIHWVDDGNHALQPRPSSGRSARAVLDELVTRIVDFVQRR